MQRANLLTGSNLGFNILLKDTLLGRAQLEPVTLRLLNNASITCSTIRYVPLSFLLGEEQAQVDSRDSCLL